MDATTQQLLSILFVLTTVVLLYTARFLQARRSSRRKLRKMAAFERLPAWSSRAIESDSPLHLAFGSAGVGEDNTATALANAELFHHLVARSGSADSPPQVTTSAAATLPLAQEVIDAAWAGDGWLTGAQWLPQGKRSLAYAAGAAAVLGDKAPPAHILAGSFGPELGLMLDSANRRRGGTLAVSDQLEGSAVAYAMADEALIGEELFAAPAYVTDEGRASADAIVMDVWRALLMILVALALVLGAASQSAALSPQLLVFAGAVALVLGVLLRLARRRRG